MKTQQSQHIWLRFALLAALLTALLSFGATQPAFADGPDKGENIMVSNDGTEEAIPNAKTNVALAFKGSGTLNEQAPSETPRNGRPMDNSAESVIGADGRTQITNTGKYPNRAIASLVFHQSDGFDYICTGWFVSPTYVMTAGHCVFDPSLGTFATNMTVYPGRNGNTLPYGSATGIKLITTKCWKNTASPECDYAIIKLNTSLGNTVGWFGFGWYSQNSSLQNKQVNVRGYPGDKPSGTMWTMKGPIEQVTSTRFGYSIDTFGGQSGAPAYGKFVFGNTTCNPCGMGIHAYGVGATPYTTRNSAVRITQTVYNFICAKSDNPSPGC